MSNSGIAKIILASTFCLTSNLFGLSLKETVLNTMNTNPEMSKNIEKYNASISALSAAQGSYLPKVNLGFTLSKEKTKTPANLFAEKNLVSKEFEASINYNLFSGFKDEYKIKEKLQMVKYSEYQIQSKANQLSEQVISAYLDVLRRKSILDISNDNLNINIKTVDESKKRLSSGIGKLSDYKQAVSRMELAYSNKIDAENKYHNSKTTLSRISSLVIKDNTLVSPDVNFLVLTSLKESQLKTETNNPHILATKANIEAKKMVVKQSESAYYPTIDLKLATYRDKNVHGLEEEDNSYIASVILKYNLYNGGIDEANKLTYIHQTSSMKKQLENTKELLNERLSIAWSTYEKNQDRLDHIEAYVKASEETWDNYKKDYELGNRNFIDVLNSEHEYNNAKILQANVNYDYKKAYFDILNVSNQLFNLLKINLPIYKM